MRKHPLASRFLTGLLVASALGAANASSAWSQDLRKQFQNPPESARPRTWWHWVSGNVSSEGITADLEAMKKIGLGGAQLFTVDQSSVKGPIQFLSPEWRQLVHQSLTEADRLGLEISIEGCDGWSESGGPWIQPSQGMQHVVWTETNVAGGTKIPLNLPQPKAPTGYYKDIALFAFPLLKGDDLPAPSEAHISAANVDASKLIDGDTDTTISINKPRAAPLQVDLVYSQPITCRSVIISGDAVQARWSGEIQVSSDGTQFTSVGPIVAGGASSFAPVTGTHFRLLFPNIPIGQLHWSEIRMGGPRVDRLTEQVGMRATMNLPFTPAQMGSDEVIDPAKLIDLTGKTEWDAPPGRWTIVRMGHTALGTTTHPSTHPGLECDKMSREAVQFHLEQMYGPVFTDSQPLVGKSLRYILLDSWEAGCADWTPKMPEEFAKRRGYSLAPWLPVFTGRVVKDMDTTERFLWDLRRTSADLVTDYHYGTAQQFAHDHHMGVYAEAPGIGLPTVADDLACKGRTDIPMGEFWVNRTAEQNIDDPKEAASAAHIYGKPIVATESFTSAAQTAAWTNDPYGLKALGDQEFCLGVNRFVFHRYAHQPWLDRKPGMSMGPWGINFERTNTWFSQGSAWIDYLSRCQLLLQQGQFVADLLYFYGEGAPAGFSHTALKPAAPTGFDYDACNAEILLEKMSVENGEIRLTSGMRYRVLVLPDTDRMTLPVLRKVQEMVRSGATVYGPRPEKSPSLSGGSDVDSQIRQIASEVWGDCDGAKVTSRNYGKGKILWGASLESALGGTPDFVAADPGMLYIHRQDDDADIYFVSNQQKSERMVGCTFRVRGKVPEIWYPDSGRVEQVALYRATDGGTTVPIHFDPIGSAFVIFRSPKGTVNSIASVEHDGQPSTDLPVLATNHVDLTVWQPGSYTLISGSGKTVAAKADVLPPAVTVDAPWQLTFPPKLGAPATATFDHLMSWTDSAEDGVKYFSGTASYRNRVTIPDTFFGKGHRIYLDLGTVKNLAEVVVNGKSLGILWKEPFRVEITDAVKLGANDLEVRVTNLWPNRLIGDQKLPENERITWASVSLYKADSPLLPSGLLGPVQIVPAQTLSFPRP